jgi:hypothetical protein
MEGVAGDGQCFHMGVADPHLVEVAKLSITVGMLGALDGLGVALQAEPFLT